MKPQFKTKTLKRRQNAYAYTQYDFELFFFIDLRDLWIGCYWDMPPGAIPTFDLYFVVFSFGLKLRIIV